MLYKVDHLSPGDRDVADRGEARGELNPAFLQARNRLTDLDEFELVSSGSAFPRSREASRRP